MSKSRPKTTWRIKDTALKKMKNIKEKFDLEYYHEIKNTVGRVRKLPSHFNPHK